MGKVKGLLHEDIVSANRVSFASKSSSSSKFEDEMYKELVRVNKQITAIRKILEECK